MKKTFLVSITVLFLATVVLSSCGPSRYYCRKAKYEKRNMLRIN